MDVIPSQVVDFIGKTKSDIDTNLSQMEGEKTDFLKKPLYLGFASQAYPNAGEKSHPALNNSISDKTESSNITVKARQEVERNRSFSKMDKVWRNRGLSVDRKILGSDRTKDAFNMKNLREALPSTSEPFSERISFLRRKLIMSRTDTPSVELARRRTNESSSSGTAEWRKGAFKNRLPTKFVKVYSSCFVTIEKIKPGDMSKGGRTDANMKETFQDGASRGQEISGQPNVCPEFAKMSLDDEQEESALKRPNSDVKNESPRLKLTPPLKVLQGGRWSSCDSERKPTIDIQVLKTPAPFYSSNKDERGADRSERMGRSDGLQPLSLRRNSISKRVPEDLARFDSPWGNDPAMNKRLLIAQTRSKILKLRTEIQKLRAKQWVQTLSFVDNWRLGFLQKSFDFEMRTLKNCRESLFSYQLISSEVP